MVSRIFCFKRAVFLLASLFLVSLNSAYAKAPALSIGEPAPDFTTQSSKGEFHLYKEIEGKYALLFSHPHDFTPVCATELAEVQKLLKTFSDLNTAVIGLSLDSVARHQEWEKDIAKIAGKEDGVLDFPIVADGDLKVSKLYGMLSEEDEPGVQRTAKDNKTARTVFLVGIDKRIKMMLTYPMTTGRNFDEIIRVLRSIQLTDKAGVATPVNWQDGEDVVVSPGMTDADARAKYGDVKIVELPSKANGHKDYLRTVKQPQG